MYIICHSIVAILVDLHSQLWINISLFELVVAYIETHIFVPDCSISHVFISIITFFCCFFLLGKIITLNLQYSKTCNQQHIYSYFEQISSFSCFTVSHARLQRVTIITRKCFYLTYVRSRGCLHWYRFQ